MKRVLFALLVLLAQSVKVTEAGPPTQACAGVAITAPKANDQVRGRVEISGSATIAQFQFYKVEFAPGANPSESSFRSISPDVRRTAVQNGVLETWDTTGQSDGPHVIRLTVVDIRGNFPCPPVLVRVNIANRAPTQTVTVTPTEVVTPTVGLNVTMTRPPAPTISSPPVTPRPSPTRAVTPAGTESRSPINLDFLADLAPALWWGVCAMGGLVGLSIAYFLARAILDRL